MVEQVYSPYQVMNTSVSKRDSATKNLGKDEFLKLLITELKNQNPLEPLDSKEYIAQLATFTQVEQIQEMRRELSFLSSISWIGKKVKAVYEEKEYSGEVKGIVLDNNEIGLLLGDEEVKVPLSSVKEIK
ncbi:flagellar hook assembly protein FlgD [Thermovenabulum sp.]|uniref:flagellar hook assembly protein FlgD n=1 Tax=Thermovenabulum sp. TaxID=3100335 RepID=UPI003C7C0937